MSEKKRVTVSLSETNLAWLDANYNNRSAYINDLLENAREGSGQVDHAVKQYQRKQLQSEIDGMRAELETKVRRLESLESELQQSEDKRERLLQKACEALDGTRLDPENPAVKTWAEKTDLTPEELIGEIE